MGEPAYTHYNESTATYLKQSDKFSDVGVAMGEGSERGGNPRLMDSQKSQKTEVVSSDAILAGVLAPSQLVQVNENNCSIHNTNP